MIDLFPLFLAAAVIVLAALTFWVGSSSSNQARRSMSDTLEKMATRIARLEEEDRKKWEKIDSLERQLSQRGALIRELYNGALAMLRQLKEAGIPPAWAISRELDYWANGPGPLGVNTQAAELTRLIIRHFNDQELRELCLDLDLNYERLQGATIDARAASLVTYFERRGQLGVLINYCIDNRPGVYGWPII